jgi:hypothetical protein
VDGRALGEGPDPSTAEELVQEWSGDDATTDGVRRKAPGLQPRTELLENTTKDRQR